jgi:hypothetical protein
MKSKLERQIERQLAPIKRDLRNMLHDRLVQKAREFVENKQGLRQEDNSENRNKALQE